MLFSCESDIEVINLITNKYDFPGLSGEQVEIIYSDSGIVKIKALAPELKRYLDIDDPYTEFPKGLYVIFYDSNKEIESEIRANYATFYETEDLWEAQNNVVATNAAGEVLNTEQLFWDQNKELVYTEKFVKITTENEILMGDGFESDQRFRKWKIKKLKGTFYFKDE